MTELDDKDLAIMRTIEDYGPKISTDILSGKLGYPSRTIRYRINKLKEKGYLKPIKMKTHERKLGMGENIIVLDVNQKMQSKLLNIFKKIPCIYHYYSTYGKYNGYLIRSGFSLNQPNINLDLLDAMKRTGYISDYYIFELVNYRIKNKDLTFFNHERGWTYKWEEWYDYLKTIKKNKEVEFNFEIELDVDIVDFDYKDVMLLKNMWQDSSITLKKLKETLNLSEAQISIRIQKLEEKDIIKGYYLDYSLLKTEETVYFYCFLEIEEAVNNVLSCFFKLPYQFVINVESSNKFCISLGLNANDFKKFLKGFDLIRPFINSYFFQFIYTKSKSTAQDLFDLYNGMKRTWETPLNDYISIIEKEAEM